MSDFFISYNSADLEVATAIATAVRDGGFTVRFAAWEVGLGDDVAQWMVEALDDCDRLIAVASPDYLAPKAKYSALERAVILWNDIDGKKAAIIPVVVRACSLPKIIATRSRFDLTKRPLHELVQDLKNHPRFGLPSAPPATGRNTLLFGLPSLSRTIHGRDTELADLRKALLAKGEAAVVPGAVVQGQGGLGKSTLARFYAERFKGEYHGILWVAAENGPAEGICAAASALGVAVAGLAPPVAATAVLGAMTSSGQPWLLIYDNVTDEKALTGFVPQGGNIHLITTTRNLQGWHGYELIRAGMLDFATEEGAAVKVLMEAAGRRDGAADAQALAADLGGLPLALVVAGALIRDSGEGFAAYRGRLAEIIREIPPGDYPTSVYGAVKLSYDRLGADARLVLDLFAWFASEGLEARLLTDVPGSKSLNRVLKEIGEEVLDFAENAQRVSAALRELERTGLLVKEGVSLCLHRLSAMAVRGMQAHPNQWARAAAGVLYSQYPKGHNGPDISATWPICRRLTRHVVALLDTGEAPETATMEVLLYQASVFLFRMADHDQRLHLATEALKLTEARLPSSDRELALGHANLGSALRAVGDVQGAEVQTARAVALNEEFRPGTQELANSYLLHGNVVAGISGREVEGLRRFQQALIIQRRLFGRWNDGVANSLNQLGWLRSNLGQGAAALRLSRAALSILRRVLPPKDAQLGYPLLNMGAALLKAGLPDDAESPIADALALWEELHDSPSHPDRRDAADWLISCLLTRAAAGEDSGLREAKAKALCAQYGFDFAKKQARAGQYKYQPR